MRKKNCSILSPHRSTVPIHSCLLLRGERLHYFISSTSYGSSHRSYLPAVIFLLIFIRRRSGSVEKKTAGSLSLPLPCRSAAAQLEHKNPAALSSFLVAGAHLPRRLHLLCWRRVLASCRPRLLLCAPHSSSQAAPWRPGYFLVASLSLSRSSFSLPRAARSILPARIFLAPSSPASHGVRPQVRRGAPLQRPARPSGSLLASPAIGSSPSTAPCRPDRKAVRVIKFTRPRPRFALRVAVRQISPHVSRPVSCSPVRPLGSLGFNPQSCRRPSTLSLPHSARR